MFFTIWPGRRTENPHMIKIVGFLLKCFFFREEIQRRSVGEILVESSISSRKVPLINFSICLSFSGLIAPCKMGLVKNGVSRDWRECRLLCSKICSSKSALDVNVVIDERPLDGSGP